MLKTLTVSATTAAMLAVPACTDDAVAEQERPNVIVVMTDDMRVDDLRAMPQTRRLLGAEEGKGATYANAYATLPLCCPARATFLSGQYPHNHGVWDNAGDHGGIDAFDDANRLPTWLQGAGYYTSMLGKYLNGYGYAGLDNDPTYVPPGWDNWVGVYGGLRSWTNYRDFDVNRNGTLQHIRGGYQTWNFTGRALSQLRQRIPSDQPMFMWVSYLAPHVDESKRAARNGYQVWAPPRLRTSKASRPSSPAFNERYVGDKPAWIRSQDRFGEAGVSKTVQLRRERRDSLKAVDESVAKIVSQLRSLGELDDTVLMFVSDNGYLLGEHRIVNKRFPYEESISIPLLMRGPGITPGVHREPVVNVDLAATIADIADATPAYELDGKSLLQPTPKGRPILIESPKMFTEVPSFFGVRTPKWAYFEYPAGRELYSMTVDPAQVLNRAGNSNLRSIRDRLKNLVQEMKDCAGAQCR